MYIVLLVIVRLFERCNFSDHKKVDLVNSVEIV